VAGWPFLRFRFADVDRVETTEAACEKKSHGVET
jgi:hypothetical protein